MSIVTNIEELAWELRQKIDTELRIKLESKFGVGQDRYIFPYTVDGDNIKLPFAYGTRNLKIKRPSRDTFSTMDVKFEGKLRPPQKVVRKEAMELLSGKGSVMISAYPGFGKSAGGIDLACTIGFKTLIIVNKIVLMKQWESSINKFCPAALVQRLTTKSTKKDCDFYIMNAQNVEKMGKTFFADIGTVIVDEAHMIMAETLSKSLQYVFPRYLIGLTATPYRLDGLDILLDLYFGKYKIIRKLVRKHTAYKVTTGFKPKVELAKNGRVNWGSVLDSQANDDDRNELIIKIIKHYSDRYFLVLVKRVAQGEYLQRRLTEEGEDVTSLLGNNQEFDVKSRILVGTGQKVGVGFDHPCLDTLMLASDIEAYFIQYLGRVFRTEDVEPLVFDLVDNHGILNKHFNTRRGIYQDHGGTVREFDMSILE